VSFYSGFEGDETPAQGRSIPTDYANLLAWGSDQSSLWQDTAGTVPAVLADDPVGRWDDLSGNERHLTQATAGSRPLLKLGVFANRRAPLFDGVNDYLLNSALGAAATGEDTPLSFLAVCQRPATGAQSIASWAASASNNPFMDYRFGSNRYEVLRRDTAANPVVTVQSSIPLDTGLHVVAFVFDGGFVSMWQDRANRANQVACNVGSLTINRFGLGAKVSVTISQYLAGYIGEWMIYSRALTDTERTRLTFGLAGKWGIAL
jgi:hypothetical protein